jgi:CheY-like chemotaxis protein
MSTKISAVVEGTKHLARNPLGIIAMFIVLVYGFASAMAGFSDKLERGERLPVVWFLVLFPPLVLFTFAWLVSRHHAKLYSPADYREDASFIEASVQQVEVALALGAAAARKQAGAPSDVVSDTRGAASRVAKLMTPHSLSTVRLRKLLWVDDHPENNTYEIEALQSLGFSVELASSTHEVTKKIDQCRYDLIISDMNRPGELRAGLALLSRLRAEENCTPYILYSAPATAEQQAEAWKRGAVGMTDRPHELIIMVLETIGPKRAIAA